MSSLILACGVFINCNTPLHSSSIISISQLKHRVNIHSKIRREGGRDLTRAAEVGKGVTARVTRRRQDLAAIFAAMWMKNDVT